MVELITHATTIMEASLKTKWKILKAIMEIHVWKERMQEPK